jgi:transposase InsO family protein/transposase-like protein
MNNSKAASNESAPTGQKKKRRHFSAEKKFQIYLETQRPDQPVGEILRREEMFSTDLARIRQQVREGALQRLAAKPGRKVELVSSESYDKLKAELEEKERALAEQADELAILRKKRMGVRGTDSRHLAACGDQTSHPARDCHFLSPGRFRPAQLRDSGDIPSPGRALAGARAPGLAGEGLGLADGTPGPQDALHRLLPEEIERIAAMAESQEYVDLSHRILAITAGEKGLFYASFPTVYRVLRARGLTTARGPGGRHNGHSLIPVRKELTGPNQRWCWDISYLLTLEKGVYLYLYLLLDEFSRKEIHWRIAWTQTATEARLLLEGGLEKENILALPEDQRPELINGRGRQMKAKPIRRLCEDHQMPQLFAPAANAQ